MDNVKSTSACNVSMSCTPTLLHVGSFTIKEEEEEASPSCNRLSFPVETTMLLPEIAVSSPVELDPLKVESPKPNVSTNGMHKEKLTDIHVTTLECDLCKEVQHSVLLLQLHKSTLCEKHLPSHCDKCRVKIKDFPDLVIHILEHEAGTERKCLICLCKNIDNMKEHILSAGHMSPSLSSTDSKAKKMPKNLPRKRQLQSKSILTRNTGNLKSRVGNGCSQEKPSGFRMDLLSAPETIWLASPSKQAKQLEKIHLRTTVQIKRLTKLAIEETSVGKWRCNACGKLKRRVLANGDAMLLVIEETSVGKWRCNACEKLKRRVLANGDAMLVGRLQSLFIYCNCISPQIVKQDCRLNVKYVV
ncbi:uncharacterized protein LOC136027547 isoform X2 [Artemia franciscana]